MKIELRARGVTMDEEMTRYVERSLSFALGKFSPRVRTVRVRVEDLNGPKGGIDKRCVVSIAGEGLDRCVVEARDAAVLAAVDHAAGMASRAVARALERVRPTSGRSLRRTPSRGWQLEARAADALAD